MVGTVSLALTYVLDLDLPCILFLSKLQRSCTRIIRLTFARIDTSATQAQYAHVDGDIEMADSTHGLPSASTRSGPVLVDEDVIAESECAMSFHPASADDQSLMYALVLQKVRHSFDLDTRHPRVALKELSLALEFGEVFGLLGPNGAGKSTTFGIIAGALEPCGGEVFVAGKNLRDSKSSIHKLVGLVRFLL